MRQALKVDGAALSTSSLQISEMAAREGQVALLDSPSSSTSTPTKSHFRLSLSLILLVLLTVGDGVLVCILFDLWGERFALFINQGTALVYIVWSTLLLLSLRQNFRGGAPWCILVAIGLMNGSANFCTAISQPHTPGLSQTLLSLLVIPLVLLLAWLFLQRRPSPIAAFGAFLIIGGTAASALRGVLDHSTSPSPIKAYGWAISLYAASTVFLAGEKVFEEKVFRDSERRQAVRPMQMFFWTLTTQFVLGWALYPVQTVPAFGGIELNQLPDLLKNGTLCAFGRGQDAGCTPAHAAVFWAYCCVDFWCYYVGLWVIQRGDASLQVLSSAIALPLQQLVLCARPIVGKFAERFFWGDALALVLVLVGFGVYQGLSPEGKAARGVSSSVRRTTPRDGDVAFALRVG